MAHGHTNQISLGACARRQASHASWVDHCYQLLKGDKRLCLLIRLSVMYIRSVVKCVPVLVLTVVL